MRAADFRLLLPVAPEACAIGMAPTTSTTLTLALGDALAVALMEQRHFLPDDFRVFHPGGKLGQQMLTVAQLMHGAGELPLVRRDTGMGDTLIEMTSKGFGIAGVVDDGQLIGVVSDGDLRRNMARLMDHTAGEIATPDPLTISPEALAVRGMAIMNDRKVNVLMVVDADNRPLGVLHIHDCLRAGLV
jgi:arabinose-5-phosphate isomerase